MEFIVYVSRRAELSQTESIHEADTSLTRCLAFSELPRPFVQASEVDKNKGHCGQRELCFKITTTNRWGRAPHPTHYPTPMGDKGPRKESKGGPCYVFISSEVRAQPSFFLLLLRCTDISEAWCPKHSG